MADPRWRTTISNFKFYCFLLLFLAVQVFPCYQFIRKDNKEMTLPILLIFYVSKWKNNKKHWKIGIWRHCDVIIGRGKAKLGVGLLCTEMIIVCKFHDPSIIGSRDTEGGSEEPPPVTDWPKKPSLNWVNTCLPEWKLSSLYKCYRIIFVLLIVSTLSYNFNRCADCFQSFSKQRFPEYSKCRALNRFKIKK